MRAVLFLPVVAAVQLIESQQHLDAAGDYEGMKVTLKELAAKRTRGEELDQPSVQSVTIMLDIINSALMNALNDDRDAAQAELDQAVANVQACDDARAAWFRDVEPGYANALTQRCNFHSSCRVLEGAKCTTRNNICDAQDLRVKEINDGMCTVPDFSLGDGGKGTVVNDFMNCLATLVTSKVNAYQSGRHACRQACVDLAAATAGANLAQGTCEVATCDLEKEVQDACCRYRTCRHSAETNYYSVKGNVRTEEIVFQTQREGLECLLCYGEGIVDERRNFTHCDNPPACAELSNCPTIVYPENNPPIGFTPCTEPAAALPCDSAWTSSVYASWLGDPISRSNCIPKVTTCGACAARPSGDTCGGEQHKTDSGCSPP